MFHGAIPLLHKAVAHRVIWCCHQLLDRDQTIKFFITSDTNCVPGSLRTPLGSPTRLYISNKASAAVIVSLLKRASYYFWISCHMIYDCEDIYRIPLVDARVSGPTRSMATLLKDLSLRSICCSSAFAILFLCPHYAGKRHIIDRIVACLSEFSWPEELRRHDFVICL